MAERMEVSEPIAAPRSDALVKEAWGQHGGRENQSVWNAQDDSGDDGLFAPMPPVHPPRKKKGKKSRLPRQKRLPLLVDPLSICQHLPTPRIYDFENGDKELFIRQKAIERMENVMQHQNRIKMKKEQKQKAIANAQLREERRYQHLQVMKQKELEEEARKRKKAYACFPVPANSDWNSNLPRLRD
jgi:hypothetical protein